ncbi:hypothetical protein ACQEVF_21320 [Nonomuraea polychroma]|uniref:hypothetical protein n=1 Tax=Nonomuraea polychroma TaxID=46176 RepID=UPI003D8D12EF
MVQCLQAPAHSHRPFINLPIKGKELPYTFWRMKHDDALLSRRSFMNRVLLSGGVAAVALMAGGCASGTTSSGAASGTSTGLPSGGPAGGPGGSVVKYADFKGVTTDGTVISDHSPCTPPASAPPV